MLAVPAPSLRCVSPPSLMYGDGQYRNSGCCTRPCSYGLTLPILLFSGGTAEEAEDGDAVIEYLKGNRLGTLLRVVETSEQALITYRFGWCCLRSECCWCPELSVFFAGQNRSNGRRAVLTEITERGLCSPLSVSSVQSDQQSRSTVCGGSCIVCMYIVF